MQSQLTLETFVADEKEVLSLLPRQLQHDLLVEVRLRPVTSHSFFASLNEKFQAAMQDICVRGLQQQAVGATTLFFEKDTHNAEMVFVIDGELGYMNKHYRKTDSRVSSTSGSSMAVGPSGVSFAEPLAPSPTAKMLKKALAVVGVVKPDDEGHVFEQFVTAGTYVCEQSLWVEWRKQGALVATSGCYVLTLGAVDLKTSLSTYPIAEGRVALYAWSYARSLGRVYRNGQTITDLTRIMVTIPSYEATDSFPLLPSLQTVTEISDGTHSAELLLRSGESRVNVADELVTGSLMHI